MQIAARAMPAIALVLLVFSVTYCGKKKADDVVASTVSSLPTSISTSANQ